MIGIVLAAGIASRLRPLTENTPKCLLPVGGVPLLERTLRSLELSGFDECIIVTGFLHEKIEQFTAALKCSIKIQFLLNSQFASTNNNYSLWLAGRAAQGRDFLLLDADILFDRRLIPLLLDSPHANALIIRSSRTLGPEEIKVEIDKTGRILQIGKDVDPVQSIGESVGIEKFGAPAADHLLEILNRRKERNEFYEASFQELFDGGCPMYVVDSGPYGCIEIDTQEDLLAAQRLAPTLLS